MPTKSTDKEIRAKLDEYGVVHAEQTVEEDGFPVALGVNVAKWLAEKEEDEKRKNKAYDHTALWLTLAGVVVGVAGVVIFRLH